jgi:hypothetical protein
MIAELIMSVHDRGEGTLRNVLAAALIPSAWSNMLPNGPNLPLAAESE